VFEHVAEHARNNNVDLIVLGSHGRRGIGRALMGSDAEQIIRHAPVPVLVVRGDAAPKATLSS
jgi:nucleotide-binding universal stress UspA family protein